MKQVLSFLMIIAAFVAHGQKATVYGTISDEEGSPLELVNVSIMGLPGGASTNANGTYEFNVPAEKEIEIIASFIGFGHSQKRIKLKEGERKELNFVLAQEMQTLPNVVIEDKQIRHSTLERIDPKDVRVIPSVSGSVESMIKTMPGVSANNELSSQYSVRGGNFDENLVYVNDIEIYRPFLVSSGQQEGLSFLNPDLVSSISFSAGGFDAKFGDKMSSVLDITYKRPTGFAASVDMSLLGGNGHIQGISKNKKFTYLLGVRQKSNQYILKGLETKGEYKPVFTDVQGILSYQITNKWNISFLGNYSRNKYRFVPTVRETDFGTITEAYRLTIYFDGQEVDSYVNGMGAITATYQPHEDLKLKFIASAYNSVESETYDLQGQYWIGLLDNDLGADEGEFDEVVQTIGVGTFLEHARNYLNTTVASLQHRGTSVLEGHTISWGANFQHEYIDDQLSEWDLIDSAGYSLPRPSDSIGYINPLVQPFHPLEMDMSVKGNNTLQSNRFTAFVQDSWDIFTNKNSHMALTFGVRAHYWDYNSEFLVSPRATLSYKPAWERDVVLRFSSGIYYQPPFYRELRDLYGNVNPDIEAQRSIHFVAGSDWNFLAWNRPFKFITEVYYKKLDNLIPYKVDNVRIRYYADNIAHGYSTGIDFKVMGEFVKGVDSWMTLSLLKTAEDIEGDFYTDENGNVVEAGYIPRPTDQRVNVSIFFQDYLPKNPTWKMQLNLLFGTGLPFGPTKSERYEDTLRMSPYRRVDIGFSKMVKGSNTIMNRRFFNTFDEIWITAEVLNLLQISNTISYLWVSDVSGYQWAVPNYLTPRQLNVKLIMTF